MQSPPPSSECGDDKAFDPSRPFAAVVVCCTSIPPDRRSSIASKTEELGGIHKYDLTPDVTHLIVGEYDTPKYRHVAKYRPDIKPMAMGWVEVVRNLWVADEPIDFEALEKEWCLKTFEIGGGGLENDKTIGPRHRLRCCLTGFEDYNDRQQIIDKLRSNGADYTGDLSKQVTHLVVYKPDGKKYRAARSWKLHIVSLTWVHDCEERGMILEESLYDPLLPKEELGKGSWNKRSNAIRPHWLGKRQRGAAMKQAEERRKLRKTTSKRLNSQRDNMWGEILGQPSIEKSTMGQTEGSTQPLADDPLLRPSESVSRTGESNKKDGACLDGTESKGDRVFASCCFYVFGFSQPQSEVVFKTVSSLGGIAVGALGDITTAQAMLRRFVIVPQSADPKLHPCIPEGVDLVTESFVERCLHRRLLLDPKDHVIGRPFPVFPIGGFDKLSICTAGFTDVDLLQVDRSIRQLGARFEERFNGQCSLLLCASLNSVRTQKLDMALWWKVPVIRAEWLWECISQGKRLPTRGYLFPELDLKPAATAGGLFHKQLNRSKSISDMSKGLASGALSERADKSGRRTSLGKSADMLVLNNTSVVSAGPAACHGDTSNEKEDSLTTDFMTALTVQSKHTSDSQQSKSRIETRNLSGHLTEKSANELNKGSTNDVATSQSRRPLADIRNEVCDSEAGDDDEVFECDGGRDRAQAVATNADAVETEKRRCRRELENKAEAERVALSNKLASLLSGNAVATSSSDKGAIGVMKEISRPKSTRKRDVIGRADSGVSAWSTGSADSNSGAGVAGRWAIFHEGDWLGEDDDDNGRNAAPIATQIEYDDPDAKASKARLVSKMLGESSAGEPGLKMADDGAATKIKIKNTAKLPARSADGRSLRSR